MFANTKRQDLIEHSISVAMLSENLFKKFVKLCCIFCRILLLYISSYPLDNPIKVSIQYPFL